MQRVNEYRFYELGQKINAIRGITQATEYEAVWDTLWEARDALEQLKTDAIALRLSVPVVDRVIAAITAIVPTNFRDAIDKEKHPEDAPPPRIGFKYYDLSESLKAFEPVLAAECTALDTYVVSQKRGYSTPDLVERSEVMLPLETRAVLSESIAADIRFAGRCMAFDTPTAAGFHILRAVEAVMALFYTHITGREIAKRHRNWGLYLKRLEKHPGADAKIRGALEHIKENYRNPITHPEVTLTEGEALMVFALSLSVIELMAEVLRTTPPALTQMEQAKALSVIAEQAASEPADDF